MIDKDINSGRFDNCKIRKHAQISLYDSKKNSNRLSVRIVETTASIYDIVDRC